MNENFFSDLQHWDEQRVRELAEREALHGAGDQRQWDVLNRVTRLLNTLVINRQEMLREIVDISLETTHGERGAILLFDEEGKWEVEVARNASGADLAPEAMRPSSHVISRVFTTLQAVTLDNVAGDEELAGAESIVSEGLKSVMCVPLKFRVSHRPQPGQERRRFPRALLDRIKGAIYVDSSSKTRVFSRQDKTIFEVLSGAVANILINAELYRNAATDPLTHLLTRRHFEELFEEELQLTSQRPLSDGRGRLSVLMADLDHFKRVNDTFGHAVGDEVLKKVAGLFRAATRAHDVIGRYGGEEFIILLADTDVDGARAWHQKLQAALASMTFSVSGLQVTVSLGLSVYPDHARERQALVEKADRALYQSKHEGRNRLTAWTAPLDAETPRCDKLAGILTGDPARDYRNVSMLLETISALYRHDDQRQLLTGICDKIIEVTGVERCLIFLRQEAGSAAAGTAGSAGEPVLHLGRDRQKATLTPPVPFSRSTVTKVLRFGKAIMDIDSLDESQMGSSITQLGLRTLMCVPFSADPQTIGAVYVDSQFAHRQFTEADLSFFSALCSQIALALRMR